MLRSVDPWVAYHRERPHAMLRLFCFPYAGGGAAIYRTWADLLPDEIEVYPVQLPGREQRMRENGYTHLLELVEVLSDVLHPYMDRPFALFGHSMGALISFELARVCFRKGIKPVHLLVSACRAPQLSMEEPPMYTLPDEQLIERLRRLNGTSEAALRNTELMKLMLPLLRTDFMLVETYDYCPQGPLPCPISAYRGTQDDRIGLDDLEAWREHTASTFSLRQLPGDHFYLHSALSVLLAAIEEDLSDHLNPLKNGQDLVACCF